MKEFGAKIISKFIKNPQKRDFVYKILTDGNFAESVIERENYIKKLFFYTHNYLKRKNCVVVWIVGGLGNQMYLYAFGKMLECRGYSVIFDCGTYGYAKNTNGGGDLYKSVESSLDSANFSLDSADCAKSFVRNLEILNFNLTSPLDLDFDREIFFDLNDANRAFMAQDEKAKTRYRHLITGIEFQTQNLDFIPQGAYFDGYWFSLQYFKDCAIEKEFSLKTPLSPTNARLKEYIKNTPDSAFLHIRRGDYLEIDTTINLCDGAYYEGAIYYLKSMLKKPHIFIFSNDIAWCKQYFLSMLSDSCKEGVEFEFVANNGEDSAVQEMELMRSCQNAIIANSTFSWWASYLIDNTRKIVVMPNRYHKDSALITYNNDTVVFESVVLCDAKTGEIL